MTIVEFFDNDDIENVISMLLCAPQNIIFVGDNMSRMKKAVESYSEVAEKRYINVNFSYVEIKRNNLMNIVSVLTDIVEKNSDCTFDLAGGEDLYLVAVGIVHGKYPERVKLHRFNINNGKLYDCDCDGNVMTHKETEISIEENIKIYGGRIIYENEKVGATFAWNWDDDFIKDVVNMWELCKADTGKWNTQINTLYAYDENSADKQSLEVRLDRKINKLKVDKKDIRLIYIIGMFKAFERKKLIKKLKITGDEISFSYKNIQVKKCLTKAGQILELFVTLKASMAVDEEKNPIYDDVMSGVYIDWDGVLKSEDDVDNEIDVLLIKGLTPVFISCKNGFLDANELYKFSTVAERFGGKYAKKILIASEINELKNGGSIMARANEMGIKVIDNITKVSDVKAGKMIKNLGN